MSRGVLMTGHNNRTIDYGKIALANACLIKKHLKNNNVTLITDVGTIEWLEKNYSKDFIQSKIDNIQVVKRRMTRNSKRYHDTSYTKKVEQFYNINRADAYELSPYDETLLIDVDYLIGNNILDNCWDLKYDLQINSESRDIFANRKMNEFKRVADRSVDFYWATVVFFRKSEENKMFFDLIKNIQTRWPYYSMLYDFVEPNFRNDHAFSIAVHMFNGMQSNNLVSRLPLPYLEHCSSIDDMVDCTNGNHFKFLLEKPGRKGDYLLCKTENTNVHVMNKFALNRLSDKIIEQNK
tara:strand:+ start:1187 stop:2068 length:882 start_codon:yes stop_codon:yes gene_type:complete